MAVKLVPNQKIVRAEKENVNGKKKPYLRLNQDSLFIAMQNLSKKGSLRIYLYIMKNQDCWDFALSSKHIMELCNISKQAYDDGITELIEKGYLVPIDKSKNRWKCYELPERYKEKAEVLDCGAEEFQF